MAGETNGSAARSASRAARFVLQFQLGLVRATRLVIIVLSAVFVLVTIYAIGSRYIFGFSIIWVEEAGRFLLAWLVFLGISVAVHERGHISMEAFRQRLPFRMRKLLDAIFSVLAILFLAVITSEGLKLAISVLPQTSPALRITYFWPYLSLPVGAALAIAQLLFVLYRDLMQLAGRDVQIGEPYSPPRGI